jgi:hypothetical protein
MQQDSPVSNPPALAVGRLKPIVLTSPPLPKKEGDPYRPQRDPRWVPAAGPIRAGLTSQAIRASPALGYSTNLVCPCKDLIIVPAKTVLHSASALYISALKDGASRG